MNKLINPLEIGTVLREYNLCLQNKYQVVFMPQRKTRTWSAISKLLRKLEFKQTVVDQHQHLEGY